MGLEGHRCVLPPGNQYLLWYAIIGVLTVGYFLPTFFAFILKFESWNIYNQNESLYLIVCVELGSAFHIVTDANTESQSLRMYIVQAWFTLQVGIASRGESRARILVPPASGWVNCGWHVASLPHCCILILSQELRCDCPRAGQWFQNRHSNMSTSGYFFKICFYVWNCRAKGMDPEKYTSFYFYSLSTR